MGDDREMVQAFLHEKACDAIGVKYEISTIRFLISDDSSPVRLAVLELQRDFGYPRKEGNELGCLGEDVDVVVRDRPRDGGCGFL